ncbi:hypothetical protein MKY41_04085 [Sporosarcina sp. FSL W7-1349]|uniref:hypothetical protein n=1 Tax=Sporosarcina sp. FSL W7-1349 TaxID=2921561 RepID=UPI0030FBFCAD
MKNYGWSILFLILYSFPYGYLAMYVDFAYWSMFGYVPLLVVPAVLAYKNKQRFSIVVWMVGNVFSYLISRYLTLQMTGIGNWDGYFKPFYPVQLLLVISVLNLILQSIALYVRKRKKS